MRQHSLVTDNMLNNVITVCCFWALARENRAPPSDRDSSQQAAVASSKLKVTATFFFALSVMTE